jgi:hypothetical protein
MAFFITEKAAEELLELETRDIPMPDGTARPFIGFKLMWKSYDFLIICGKYTGKRLVDLAIRNSEEMGYSFEESFPAVLSYVHRHVRKAMGID